jgi:hypothetical protein
VELSEFFMHNLSRIRAEHEVHFIRGAIDAREEALEIDCAAGACGCDDKFHGAGRITAIDACDGSFEMRRLWAWSLLGNLKRAACTVTQG